MPWTAHCSNGARYAVAIFFKELPGAELADNVNDESMAIPNYFLIAPKGHKFEIVLLEQEAGRSVTP